MDGTTWIYVLIGVGIGLTVVFWAGVIYLMLRLSSKSGASYRYKIGLISGLLSACGRRHIDFVHRGSDQ